MSKYDKTLDEADEALAETVKRAEKAATLEKGASALLDLLRKLAQDDTDEKGTETPPDGETH